MPLLDRHHRPLRNLRLSVTDRCNLRCRYCMPAEDYVWLPKTKVLRFEEIVRLVDCFIDLGVDRVRITGGEPLLRSELEALVDMLARRPQLNDIALTTNGVLLADKAQALRDAGLGRVTVSLDSLDRDTFEMLTRRDDLDRVLAGIAAAKAAGFAVKIDTVVIADVNDDQLPELLAFGREQGVEVRFIEYMDVGGATQWRAESVVSRARMLESIAESHGAITPLPRTDSAPAERFELADGTTFGVISSMTQPFCSSCDRARLTADGMWFTCLYALQGHDLGGLMRSGASDADLVAAIRDTWAARLDRGAEERATAASRRPLARRDRLRADPHLEMHTRGG